MFLQISRTPHFEHRFLEKKAQLICGCLRYKTLEKLQKATEKTNVEISLQEKIVIQELFAHLKMDKPQSSCPFVDG